MIPTIYFPEQKLLLFSCDEVWDAVPLAISWDTIHLSLLTNTPRGEYSVL